LWFNAPTAERVSESVTDGGTFMDVTVRYIDAVGSAPSRVGISWGSVGDGDVRLVKGNTAISGRLMSQEPAGPGRLNATYRFAAPGGFWDHTDSGSWSLRTVAGAVFDEDGFGVAELNLRSYPLSFTTPNARVTAFAAARGGSSAVVTVEYTALNGGLMSWDSFGAGDLELRGSNGVTLLASQAARSWTLVNDRYVYTVSYTFAAPGGTWGPEDDGYYSTWVRPGQVVDAAGRAVPPVAIEANRHLVFV
ncbi:MAG: hypothetical protein ACOYN0_08335, partial [Phycisphaerales bacterium]